MDLVTQALILGLATDFKSNRKEVSIHINVVLTHSQAVPNGEIRMDDPTI